MGYQACRVQGARHIFILPGVSENGFRDTRANVTDTGSGYKHHRVPGLPIGGTHIFNLPDLQDSFCEYIAFQTLLRFMTGLYCAMVFKARCGDRSSFSFVFCICD